MNGVNLGEGEQAAQLGEGVQVVRLGEGARRYELDEDALTRVLQHPDVRDLPVVVVSVAGITRSGKSFILDFFLRYLNAPRSSQLSGEWLGKEDDTLQGFHWTGGGDRDTIGIHLWPHPIITTMQKIGEEPQRVAVLLMDTQGTFDSESTPAENSTIFALSTLISSVQIYNLSGNIRGDDLLHLQLFTEYGRLACDGDERAFQKLTFLVRDWLPEYPAHGFAGGEELLNSRLEFKPNQKPELREVREHIRTCFDKINCFLMPHPGIGVGRQSFAGRLRDITGEFKSALIELVPSFFDPKHITPKLINGERVKTQELLEYFRSYVDVFNSPDTPEAGTYLRATAAASILAAVRSARSLYEARMASRLRDGVSVPARVLAALNAAAREDALQQYCRKRILGARDAVDSHLEELRTELDARLSLYTSNNEVKFRDTRSLAKTSYEDAVSAVSAVHARLCLHPLDLQDLHAAALTAAAALFDSARHVLEDEEDEERAAFVRSLEQYYEHLCEVNEQRNRSVVLEARDLYLTRMQQQLLQVGISSDLLQAEHQSSLNDARALFSNQRSRATARQDDPYLQRLLEDIGASFADFERSNTNNNRIALQAATDQYNNYISAAWRPRSNCFHQRALEELHTTAKNESLQQFLAGRPESEHNQYRARLVEILEGRYSELQTTNESNNSRAVAEAYELYSEKQEELMNPTSVLGRTRASLSMIPDLLPAYHEVSKQEALKLFYSRRCGAEHSGDVHYAHLVERIYALYERHTFRASLLAVALSD